MHGVRQARQTVQDLPALTRRLSCESYPCDTQILMPDATTMCPIRNQFDCSSEKSEVPAVTVSLRQTMETLILYEHRILQHNLAHSICFTI